MAAAGNHLGADSATFTALRISLRPSRTLLIYLCGAHGLAAIATWLSALPWWAGILINLILIGSLQRSLKRHWWPGERELVYKDGDWALVENGKREDLQLAGESFIHPWITILHFKGASGRVVLPLPFDSADPAQLKQLRRILRFGPQAEAPDLNRR